MVKLSNVIVQNKIIIQFDDLVVTKNGEMYPKIDIKKFKNYMKNKIIKINLNLKLGSHNKTVWSSDLTKRYVEINADYRS